MIGPIKTVGVYVEDQAKALEFYTQKLGFVVRRSIPMGPTANWIEVSAPGAESCLVLYPRSMMPDWSQRKLSIVFHCSDVEETYRQLEARGVRFNMQPTPLPWGMFASFTDLDGNEFGLTSQEIAETGSGSGNRV
ncbi:MAG TPA: VOC family protein [Gemmata sp.]|jgi:predicted enzyme related to lactoylglutathione lyase|nr:VOC family protein [Gemmata sp.]